MAKWYYTKNNVARGPISDEGLFRLMAQGELQVFDLVFKDGGQQWKTISEWPELSQQERTVLQYETSVLEQMTYSGERQWVVLKGSRSRGQPTLQYLQQGPFATNDIIAMLQRGEISFGDYAWRAGFKKWIRIGQIQEFDRRRRPRPDEIPISEMPVEVSVQQQIGLKDVYDHVVLEDSVMAQGQDPGVKEETYNTEQLRHSFLLPDNEEDEYEPVREDDEREGSPIFRQNETATQIESTHIAPPVERENEIDSVEQNRQLPPHALDLPDESESVVPYDLPTRRPPPSSRPLDSADQNKAGPIEMEKAKPTSAPRGGRVNRPAAGAGLRALFALSVTIGCILLLTQGARWLSRGSSAESGPASSQPGSPGPVSVSVSDTPVIQPNQGSTPQQTDAHTAASLPTPPAAPTSLEVVAVDLNSDHPQLVFNTPTSLGEPIQVWIRAHTGQILDLPSFQVAVRITRGAGEMPTLDLAPLKLPWGTYEVQARAGSFAASKTVFVGKEDDTFRKRLEAHRKQISFSQQEEKLEIAALAVRMNTQLARLQKEYLKRAQDPRAWNQFFLDWKRDWSEIKSENLGRVALSTRNQFAFPDLWMDLQAIHSAIEGQAYSLHRGVKDNRSPASQVDLTVVARMSQLNARAAKLSAWATP